MRITAATILASIAVVGSMAIHDRANAQAQDEPPLMATDEHSLMAFAFLNRCGKVMTKIDVDSVPQGLVNAERFALVVQTTLLEEGILIPNTGEVVSEFMRRGTGNSGPPINLEVEVMGFQLLGEDTEGLYFIEMLASKPLFDKMTERWSRAHTRRWRRMAVGEGEAIEKLNEILGDFVSSYMEVNQEYCLLGNQFLIGERVCIDDALEGVAEDMAVISVVEPPLQLFEVAV